MSSVGTGLRERKKEKTRRALQEKALELFARDGFDQTTVEEIADGCDVSPSTFFRYFTTKEDVLFCEGDELLAQVMATLEARPVDETPVASVRAALLELATELAADRDRMRMKSQILAQNSTLRSHSLERKRDWEADMAGALTRRGPAGPSTPTLDTRLAAAAATAALRAASDTWLADGGDLVELVSSAFDRLALGLDPPR